MATVFTDIGLSQAQVDSNYTYKQIQNADGHASANVYVDPVKNILACTNNADNVFDEVGDDSYVLAGTNLTNTRSDNTVQVGGTSGGGAGAVTSSVIDGDQVVSVGHGCKVLNSDKVVVAGGANFVGTLGTDAPGTFFGSDNVISLGYDNISGSSGVASNNINIGNDSGCDFGQNNIVMGQAPNYHDGTAVANSNNIVLAHKPLTSELVGAAKLGSIIIGGGAVPSILPKIQFLSPDMVKMLQGDAAAAYPGAGASAFPANTDGWVRMKYQGINIRLPFVLDDDTPHV